MEIKHRTYNNVLYVMLSGELDENTAKFTSKRLDDLFLTTLCKQIIIDLSELEFMDSTGIGVLLGRFKKWDRKNIQICIKNPRPQVDRVLKISGVYQLMPLYV